MADLPVVRMTWRRHVEYKPTPVRDVLPLMIGGAVLAITCLVIGYPWVSISFVGLMALPLLNHLRPRMRISIQADGATLGQQPPMRNSVVLLPLVLAVMGVAILVQLATGVRDIDWRLPVVGVGFCAVAIWVAVISAHRAGPVRIASGGVTFHNGKRFDIMTDRFVVEPMPRGAPAVKCISETPQGDTNTAYITNGQFGIDAEIFVATLDQLRTWSSDGRSATSTELKAMLTAQPPQGVALGESVELEVPIPSQAGGHGSD